MTKISKLKISEMSLVDRAKLIGQHAMLRITGKATKPPKTKIKKKFRPGVR